MGTYRIFDTNDPAALDLLKTVLDIFYAAGGRVLDSSPMYGRAEATIGLLQKNSPGRDYYLATKVWTRGHQAGIRQIDRSIELMQARPLDLMQIHNLADWRTHLKTLRAYKESGKIRAIGIISTELRQGPERRKGVETSPRTPLFLPVNSLRSHVLLLSCVLFIGLAPAAAGPRDPCRGFKNETERKTCYEKKYKEADYELNQVYRRLQKELPKDHATEMQSSSRSWIRMKEYFCGFQASLATGRDNVKDSGYYSCLLLFTRDRTQFLRQAFAREGVRPGLPGDYADGVGGRMTLRKPKNGTYGFSMEVVRGPTAHIGEIHGDIQIAGRKGEFQSGEYCEKSPDETGTTCCRISLRFHKYHVKVEEENCEGYRGARAYFSGDYRKIR